MQNKLEYIFTTENDKSGVFFDDLPPLILTKIVNHFAIHVIHAFAGDIALQVTVGIKDREPVGLSAFESFHNLRHRSTVAQYSSRLYHQLMSLEMVI